MAERVGFEPTIPLQVCRISSAVHSTTLPPLRMRERLRCALLININGGTDKGNFVFVSQIIRHGQGCINASASGRFVDIFTWRHTASLLHVTFGRWRHSW